tara:strand:+ start:570 stop:1304 length:735 start_codon:yes stop_codon:yes gene_type:complete
MNKLTKDFHDAKFSGFVPDFSYEHCIAQFWKSKTVPFIDTKIDLSIDTTYKWLLNNDHLFVNHHSLIDIDKHIEKLNAGWFTSPRQSNWTTIGVFGTGYKNTSLIDNGIPIEFNTVQPTYPDAAAALVNQFTQLNLPIFRAQIARLAPGGWVQPHLDNYGTNDPKMTHCWVPLHDSNDSIKVYPFGDIPHKAGRIYLLNNMNFLHSIVNMDSKPRYVALLKLKHSDISDSLWEHLQTLIKEQWF